MTDTAPSSSNSQTLVVVDPITIDVEEISDDEVDSNDEDVKTRPAFPFPGLILAMASNRVDVPPDVNLLEPRQQTNCILSKQYRLSDAEDVSDLSDNAPVSSDSGDSSSSSDDEDSGDSSSSEEEDSPEDEEDSSSSEDENKEDLDAFTRAVNDEIMDSLVADDHTDAWSTRVLVDDADADDDENDMSDESELYDAPPENRKLRLSQYSPLKTLQRFLPMSPHVFLNALKQSNQLSYADEAWDLQDDGGWVYNLSVRWFEYQFIMQSHTHTNKKDAKGAAVVAFHTAMRANANCENMFHAVGNLVAHLIIGQHPPQTATA